MGASEYFLLAIDLCNQNLDRSDVITELEDAMVCHGDYTVNLNGKKYFFFNARKIYRSAKHCKF